MIANEDVRNIAAALLVWTGVLSPLAAQTYPSKPIRIVVPLPPGSNGDLMPRILGTASVAKLGQPVVIENRSGAAQNLGAEYVSRAEPDGYTLLATPQGPLVISPSFLSEPAVRSVAVRADHHHGEAALHPGGASEAAGRDVRRVHRLRQGQPGKLNYGTPGLGSSSHLTGEMLKLAAGIQMTHVPYAGLRRRSPICSPATPT